MSKLERLEHFSELCFDRIYQSFETIALCLFGIICSIIMIFKFLGILLYFILLLIIE